MRKTPLTLRQKQRKNKNSMYADYLKSIESNPKINKSELRRRLARDYGYTGESSVNTIICKIEKENKKNTSNEN